MSENNHEDMGLAEAANANHDAPSKISYSAYRDLFYDLDIEDTEIAEYCTIVKGEGGFDWQVLPNQERVDISTWELEAESAMAIGNNYCRWRRARRFKRRQKLADELPPLLVSEGDSWFQFPLLIKEVIDQLGDDYLIWSVGAAGDTADNMLFGAHEPRKCEYMKELRRYKSHVKAFLLSAAGNDIIGEDPKTNKSSLYDILRNFNGNVSKDPENIAKHINQKVLRERMRHLRNAYQSAIDNVRAEPGLESLPIIVHGYDYPFPYPHGEHDRRNPVYAKNDEWLGEPLRQRKIMDADLRRAILKVLIDRLYSMLNSIATDNVGVWVVDCRGAMPNLSDWNDEIHGTSQGFKEIAARFRPVIQQAIAETS